jgi:hypothetical protein
MSNVTLQSLYCAKEDANVRYPSSSKYGECDGFAYLFTLDYEYVHRLSMNHCVEVKNKDGDWGMNLEDILEEKDTLDEIYGCRSGFFEGKASDKIINSSEIRRTRKPFEQKDN